MAVMALMMAGTMSACTEKSPYPGYEKTQNGLYYQFFKQNAGEKPQNGELLEVGISFLVNDSVLVPSHDDILMLQESQFAGDLYEGLAMMHKGDSASFIVNIDSTFKYLFGQPKLPEGFNSTDVLRFEICLNDYYPESEFMHRMIAKSIAKMKADYPEETAKAAQELADFLANNGVTAEPTESGLYYVMTQEGNGEKPEAGQVVTIHYTGKLLDGTVFDSSVEGDPISQPIGVGQFIPGWDEGIMMMSKGEKGTLYIPYYLAYGPQQRGDKITPFSNLIFEVELIDFE